MKKYSEDDLKSSNQMVLVAICLELQKELEKFKSIRSEILKVEIFILILLFTTGCLLGRTM